MKTYIVATNTEFTVIVRAKDKTQAIKRAKTLFSNRYGGSLLVWEAYTMSEYFEEDFAYEITLND